MESQGLSGQSVNSHMLFDKALTYRDMTARLQIPQRTLERLVSKGEIPHKRLGRHVRFFWPDIVDWLRNQKGARRR